MDGDHERRYLAYDNGEPQHFYSLGRGVFEIDHGFTVLGCWRAGGPGCIPSCHARSDAGVQQELGLLVKRAIGQPRISARDVRPPAAV
jgi:hypothetical protein